MDPYAILTVIAWGVWGFAQKNALLRLNVVTVQLSSFLTGLLIMPVYFYLMRKQIKPLEFNAPGVLWSVFSSILAAIAGFSYLQALKPANVSTIALITSTYPAITMILAVLFLGESLTVGKIISIPVIIFGIWLSGQS